MDNLSNVQALQQKTGLVLAMVFVASLFFVSVDQTLRLIVGFLLSLGR